MVMQHYLEPFLEDLRTDELQRFCVQPRSVGVGLQRHAFTHSRGYVWFGAVYCIIEVFGGCPSCPSLRVVFESFRPYISVLPFGRGYPNQ